MMFMNRDLNGMVNQRRLIRLKEIMKLENLFLLNQRKKKKMILNQ